MAKFTDKQSEMIAKAHKDGKSVTSLAEKYGCSRYAIYKVLKKHDGKKDVKKKVEEKPKVKKVIAAKPKKVTKPKPKVIKSKDKKLSAKQRNRILRAKIINLFRIKRIGAKKIARALKISIEHVVMVLRNNKLIK